MILRHVIAEMKPGISKRISIIFIIIIVFATASINTFAQSTNILAVGDISWSFLTSQPEAFYYGAQPEIGWYGIPYMNNKENIIELNKISNKPVKRPQAHYEESIHYELNFDSENQRNMYPFEKIAKDLQKADITLVNLETPLSDDARWTGAFRTPESFGEALKWAGVDVANLANNHALDAEGEGLLNTINILKDIGIGTTGAGIDLNGATKPYIIEKNGIKFGFLGYTQFVNVGISGFALPELSKGLTHSEKNQYRPERLGVAPMDPTLIKKDIESLRKKVDFIIVSIHGMIENSKETIKMEREVYQSFIDYGADVIFGSHPHVPRGIEVYQGHPIIYSTGNFIFGHSHAYWGDNYIVNFEFSNDNKKLKSFEIIPVAGKGNDMSQPFVLKGDRAVNLLREIQWRSKILNCDIEIDGNKGIVIL